MTARELITELLNNPDIDLDREVAVATKDNPFDHMEYARFHIKEVTTDYHTLLVFNDIRYNKENKE